MDNFEKAEQSGRALFKSLLEQCNITQYLETEDKFDIMDMQYTLKGKTTGVEIKKRAKQYEDYDTYLMEVSKFKALANKIKNGEIDNACYINFFGEDTAYIFSIRAIAKAIRANQIQIRQTYCNRTTAVASEKVLKATLYLPKSMALKIVKIGDKWIKPNKIN